MPHPYRNWTSEEDNRLRELVATKKHSFAQMAKFFEGRTGVGLRKHALKYLGLHHDDFVFRKHSYDQAFFATPNPLNCYVAGFYAADGYIGDNPTTRLLTISLAEQDGHQVETFKRLLRYTGNVTVDPRGHEQFCEKQKRPHCNMHSLRLYGAHQITADLERNFGLTPRKTYRIPAPNLTDPHLQFCYLIGLLDGDGCVHISNRNRLIIRYSSCSRAITDWVKTFTDSLGLQSLRENRGGEVKSDEPYCATWSYQICGAKAADLIRRAQKLKVEGIPILDRKWDNPRINAYINEFCMKHDLLL